MFIPTKEQTLGQRNNTKSPNYIFKNLSRTKRKSCY
jgi:hypothetical protein